jgi:predicted aldo/keto reductase-like oxidoreductase
MGEALAGLDRSRYLLACKTKVRDKEGARKEFEQSLVRLKTDYFDVYQLHHLHTAEDVKKAFGPNGVMEMITEAKKEGKIRFVGFSAHTTKSALDAMSQYAFDTVMFPINFIEYYQFGFGQEVLAEAQKQGAGVLAIKPMCGGLWGEKEERTRQWWYKPLEERREINMALRFTLSLPGVTAGVAPGMLDLFPKALEVVKIYQPSTEEEKRELEGMAKERISVFQADQKNYAYGDPSHYYA